MIAKFRQPGESPERSSSPLVVVVCMYAGWLPIQLSKDNLNIPMGNGPLLTSRRFSAYPEFMSMQLTFCCCCRFLPAPTDACQTR